MSARKATRRPKAPSTTECAINLIAVRDDVGIVMDTLRIVADSLDLNTDTDRYSRVLYHHALEPLRKVLLALNPEVQS